MSQTEFKPLKISIKNRSPGTISTGANTVVEIDGKPLPGITFLKIEIKPKGLAKVTLECIVDIDCLELDSDLKLIRQKTEPKLISVLSKFETEIVK